MDLLNWAVVISCFMQCTLKIIFYFFKALDNRRKWFLTHTKQYDITF